MAHPTPSPNQARLWATRIAMLDCVMPAFAQVVYRLVGTAAALLRHGLSNLWYTGGAR